jgi:hypothetical protein
MTKNMTKYMTKNMTSQHDKVLPAVSGTTRQEKIRYILNLAFAYFVLGGAIGDKQRLSSCVLPPPAHHHGHCQLRVQKPHRKSQVGRCFIPRMRSSSTLSPTSTIIITVFRLYSFRRVKWYCNLTTGSFWCVLLHSALNTLYVCKAARFRSPSAEVTLIDSENPQRYL